MLFRFFTKPIIFCACTLLGLNTICAQKKEPEPEKPPVGREYIFNAQAFSSASTSMRQLTPGEYHVRIKTDSVIVSLPYFGRALKAQMSSVDGNGINFISTKFSYSTADKKKGKVLITIKPEDVSDVQQLFLTVFSDGTSVLQVNSTSREFMSFNGYLVSK
jgi:hypothetical protein